MPYDMENMEKRKGAMKPAGSLEVEMAFNKAGKPNEEMMVDGPDVEAAIEMIRSMQIDEEDKATLLELLDAPAEESAQVPEVTEEETPIQ